MSNFKTFKIGNVELGGDLGELPTTLIGSIFYEKHKIVSDAKEGVFDKERAKELVLEQESLSSKTSNPHMVDVVGLTEKAIKRYIEFIADVTDAPILVDSTLPSVKLAGVRKACELGILDRVIYNSLSCFAKDEELSSLRDYGVKSAVLLAYNPNNAWAEGRIEVLKGSEGTAGLLSIASKAGVENVLVDVAVLDVPSIGIATEAIKLVKKEFGLPCGGGPLNAVLEWRRVKEISDVAKDVCSATAVALMQFAGANFILYGPIEKAKVVFPSAAMVDAIVAYSSRIKGIKTRTKEHPLYKIF